MAQVNSHGRTTEVQLQWLNKTMSPLALEVEAAKISQVGLHQLNFSVEHLGRGKKTSGGKPDIQATHANYIINIEVTKTTRANADREFNSIKDHLQRTAERNPEKKCFCLYVSPETFKRNMDSFSMFNKANEEKIIPLNFVSFNYLFKYAIENGSSFPLAQLKELFKLIVKTTTTDADVLDYLNQKIIRSPEIEREIQASRIDKQKEQNQEIEAVMDKIHNMLRSKYAKNPDEAVKEVSKLIFLKMYEEEKEINEDDYSNRFTIQNLADIKRQGEQDPVNYLFNNIKEEMKQKRPSTTIFDDDERIMLDAQTVNKILELFSEYNFVKLGIDIKGKIYEQFLGSTMKNTALGQYFTPEEIIDFMIKIANLKIKEMVLDPACGTGRFLTKAMNAIIKKVEQSEEHDKNDVEHIKKQQIFGIDLSEAVFKIAKMNMYIHGDGRSNIYNDNFITFNHNHKEKYDVILTNPPFGNINIVEDVRNFEENQSQIINEFSEVETTTRVEGGREVKTVKRRAYKGGALLLQKALIFLKPEKKLITVIDDGVLNTNAYKELRVWLKQHYFIKAVFSLPSTTFRRLAKSSPKSSILYLVKKANSRETQKEPIFFAHAEKIGVDTRGRVCINNFDKIEEKFWELQQRIEQNKGEHNGLFNKDRFQTEHKALYPETELPTDLFEAVPEYYTEYLEDIKDRLDFNYNNPKYKILEEMEEKSKYPIKKIEDLILNDKGLQITSGSTPKTIIYLPKGEGVPFLGATSIKNGKVDTKTCPDIDKKIHNGKLKNSKLIGGELLITMAGTIGNCAVYSQGIGEANMNQAVAAIKLNTDIAFNEYVALFLNSFWGKMQFAQNRHDVGTPNINLDEIKEIKVIVPQMPKEQEAMFKVNQEILKETEPFIKKIREIEIRAEKELEKRILNKQS